MPSVKRLDGAYTVYGLHTVSLCAREIEKAITRAHVPAARWNNLQNQCRLRLHTDAILICQFNWRYAPP